MTRYLLAALLLVSIPLSAQKPVPRIFEPADGEPRILLQQLRLPGPDTAIIYTFPPGAVIPAARQCPPGFLLFTDAETGEPLYLPIGLYVRRDGTVRNTDYALLLACMRQAVEGQE